MAPDVAFPPGPRMPDPRRAAAALLVGIAVWGTTLLPRAARADDFAAPYGSTLPDGRRFVGYRYRLEACAPGARPGAAARCLPMVDLPMEGVSKSACVAGANALNINAPAQARLFGEIPAGVLRKRWTCSPLYAAPEA